MQSKKYLGIIIFLFIVAVGVAIVASKNKIPQNEVENEETFPPEADVVGEYFSEPPKALIDLFELEPIEGFTQEQSLKIRDELQERILYKEPGSYAILEVWLDGVDVSNGKLLGNMFFQKGMKLRGLDVVTDIEALQMDGRSWLSVTAKMVFEGEEGDYIYEDSTLRLMVPVTITGETIETGDIYREPDKDSMKEALAYYEELGFSAITCNVITADVTHDGVDDEIVTVLYNDPDALSGDVYEVLNKAGVGFVQVFDGSVEATTENIAGITEENRNLIWQKEFAHARVGNTQVSVVTRDGMDYLLVSNINEQQGGFSYSYQVVALDSDSHEYVVDEASVGFDTPEHAGIPTEEQKGQLQEFKATIEQWFTDATLIVATDVNADRHYVSTMEEMFAPNDYYNSVWARY